MREVRLKIAYMAMIAASNDTTWMWAHSIMSPIKVVVHDDWKRTAVKIISSSPWTL